MIYDIAAYRRTVKPQVKAWCDTRSGNPVDHIGEIALYTSCPIVVVCHLVGELYGSTPELESFLTKQVEFYKPEAIINKEVST